MRRVLAAVMLTSVAGVASAQSTAPPPEQTAEVQAALAAWRGLVRIHVVSVDFQAAGSLSAKRRGAARSSRRRPGHHEPSRGRPHARDHHRTLASREEIPAELVGTDPLDIAVLRLRPGTRTFPVATFGDVTKLKVGDRVLALGSPLALSQSVTMRSSATPR
jgi:hypothetical protein